VSGVGQARNPGLRDPGLAALARLAAIDADIAGAWTLIGDPPPRRQPKGFPGLLHAIVAQQISAAAARAIWSRLETLGPVTAAAYLTFKDEQLRAAGLSRPKIAYAHALATAIAERHLDLARLHRLGDEDAVAELTKLRGIGRWSAEVYLLFSLGREDAWPADDLALQTAAQRLKRLERRPSRTGLIELAEPWRPWRGAAARFLWHYYAATRRPPTPPLQR